MRMYIPESELNNADNMQRIMDILDEVPDTDLHFLGMVTLDDAVLAEPGLQMPFHDPQIAHLCIVFQVRLAVQIIPLIQIVRYCDVGRFKQLPRIIVFIDCFGKCRFRFLFGLKAAFFLLLAFAVNCTEVKIIRPCCTTFSCSTCHNLHHSFPFWPCGGCGRKRASY